MSEIGLSEAGVRRREAILPVLETALAGRMRRSRAARSAAVLIVIGGIAALAFRGAQRPATFSPAPVVATSGLHMEFASLRIVASAPPTFIREVDDETLLRELRDSGRPTGLIRTAGHVVLTGDLGLKAEQEDSGPS
jgi:hypothetical protein